MDFTNRVVLVTGSSTGIGLETARLFHQSGASVVINGASERGWDIAKQFGVRALFLRADVGQVEQCRQLVKDTICAFGRLDVLVNNAGIVPVGTVQDVDEADFDQAFSVNVKSAFFLSQYAVAEMKRQGGGVIINIASVAGLIGPKNRALYSATKGAMISLTRAMASDHAKDNIRVNCVCPGMVKSESLIQRINAMPDPIAAEANFKNAIPIGRIGNVTEIAHMILTAASQETGFMTGSILTIDGGASL